MQGFVKAVDWAAGCDEIKMPHMIAVTLLS